MLPHRLTAAGAAHPSHADGGRRYLAAPMRTVPLVVLRTRGSSLGPRWPMRLRALLTLAVPGLLAAGCARPAVTPGASAAVGSLRIERAVAANSVGTAGTTVLFRVVNGGAAADTLVGAASDVAASAMLHDVVPGAGMRPLGPVPIAPGATLRLHEGGPHLMLSQLVRRLDAGDSIAVTLRFAVAGSVSLRVPVLRLTEAFAAGN